MAHRRPGLRYFKPHSTSERCREIEHQPASPHLPMAHYVLKHLSHLRAQKTGENLT